MSKNILIILIVIYLFMTPPIQAASSTESIGCGVSVLGNIFCPSNNPDNSAVGNQLNKTIGGIIGFMTAVAGLWFIFQFIIGGYQWINSAGDKSALEAARNKIYHALIGILVVSLAWIIVGLLGQILGIDILNPGSIIQDLGIAPAP